MNWDVIVEAASRVAQERAAAREALSAPGETCVKCGGESVPRPSGDRVCNTCGYAWAIGEIRTELPKP